MFSVVALEDASPPGPQHPGLWPGKGPIAGASVSPSSFTGKGRRRPAGSPIPLGYGESTGGSGSRKSLLVTSTRWKRVTSLPAADTRETARFSGPFGAADNLAPLPESALRKLDRVPALGPGMRGRWPRQGLPAPHPVFRCEPLRVSHRFNKTTTTNFFANAVLPKVSISVKQPERSSVFRASFTSS